MSDFAKDTNVPTNDCISRQDAIDAVKDLPNCHNGFSDTYDKACIISTIEDVPTADVRPYIPGKWINDKGLYKCSVCNELWLHWWACVVGDERMSKMMKFCPNCGADMRGNHD